MLFRSYPDQSLYPVDSVPRVVKGINNAFRRADQIEHSEGQVTTDYFLPIVADAEAGFGGALNAYELMMHMIEAGAAGVHFEDQLVVEWIGMDGDVKAEEPQAEPEAPAVAEEAPRRRRRVV